LEFLPLPSDGAVSYSGCSGDGFSVVVNGTLYNESNPSGSEGLTGSNTCDSTVNIDLTFLPNATGSLSYSGCEGDGYSVTVNGSVYNESNSNGVEVLSGGAANGCDSTVTVNLSFAAEVAHSITYDGCQNDGYSVVVNGTTYDQANSSGVETFVNGAFNGCDSVVTVSLTFNGLPSVTLANNGGALTASSSSAGTYQWYQNDVLIPDASGASFTATEDGTYHVVLTDANGCEGTSNDVTVVLSTVLDAVLNASISIYPNPVKKTLTVEFAEFGTENMKMSVIDIAGRELLQRNVDHAVEQIDMRKYSSGVYMLRIETSDGNIAIRKVVKD